MIKTTVLATILALLGVLLLLAAWLLFSIGYFARYWDRQRSRSPRENAITYVALGDSAAQGLGASWPTHGYVGGLAARLAKQSGRPIQVINLSKSGATIQDVIDEQLPILQSLKPDVVTMEIGANDIAQGQLGDFEARFRELIAGLPERTVVSDLPYFGGRTQLPGFGSGQPERDAQKANVIIRRLADEHRLPLAHLHAQTDRRNHPWWNLAVDLFHPNDLGYRAWTDAFWEQVRKIQP